MVLRRRSGDSRSVPIQARGRVRLLPTQAEGAEHDHESYRDQIGTFRASKERFTKL